MPPADFACPRGMAAVRIGWTGLSPEAWPYPVLSVWKPLRVPAMRILVAWDDANEAELLKLYLTNGDNDAVLCATREEVLAQVEKGPWEAVLMTLTFPKTADESFALFGK